VQLADSRPLLFAGLFLPVLGWVAFNIAAPALRQIDAMGDKEAPKKGAAKKRAAIAGLTGLTAAAMMADPESADAAQARAPRRSPGCPAAEQTTAVVHVSTAFASRRPHVAAAAPQRRPPQLSWQHAARARRVRRAQTRRRWGADRRCALALSSHALSPAAFSARAGDAAAG
jgi:hypothetical protein